MAVASTGPYANHLHLAPDRWPPQHRITHNWNIYSVLKSWQMVSLIYCTATVLWPFFWDHPGEPVPEENLWTLWCKGRLTEADTPTIWLGATPSGLTSAHLHHPLHIFYRPDALPAAQPTASMHWRQQALKATALKLNLLHWTINRKNNEN